MMFQSRREFLDGGLSLKRSKSLKRFFSKKFQRREKKKMKDFLKRKERELLRKTFLFNFYYLNNDILLEEWFAQCFDIEKR